MAYPDSGDKYIFVTMNQISCLLDPVTCKTIDRAVKNITEMKKTVSITITIPPQIYMGSINTEEFQHNCMIAYAGNYTFKANRLRARSTEEDYRKINLEITKMDRLKYTEIYCNRCLRYLPDSEPKCILRSCSNRHYFCRTCINIYDPNPGASSQSIKCHLCRESEA